MPLAADHAKELKVALSQTLIALAADGITIHESYGGKRWKTWH